MSRDNGEWLLPQLYKEWQEEEEPMARVSVAWLIQSNILYEESKSGNLILKVGKNEWILLLVLLLFYNDFYHGY